ncbi:hypothetical protein D5F01_LYC00236 [Larimichthys crocea]|uniref:Ig-like domain-containing protein n=1 Tax=Larimichthys crocea TaxID=215358 RepID=A0A6G0J987_LARCR|nr:hypothetical protein D5F01_LYC00236 [Larimichthys crocea]
MDVLHILLIALLGVVSYSHGQISGSELEVTARPGDNVTLYCDCKKSSGVYIVWFRNCSHENQPSLVLTYEFTSKLMSDDINPIPRFYFVRNDSSNSYDLMIMNVTDLDEGLYYCGKSIGLRAKETQVDQRQSETRGLNQDEDVCYAALEIRQTSNRPKKKKTQSSDFSTYSAINTSRASRA